MGSVKEVMLELGKQPTEKNWKAFSLKLHRSSIRYYRIIFTGKGGSSEGEDLKKSYAELYDAGHMRAGTVPLFVKEGGKIRGSTAYLKGLGRYGKVI